MNDVSAYEMANMLCSKIADALKDKASCFEIHDIYDNNATKEFTLTFIAFNYFCVDIQYDKGRLQVFIQTGSIPIQIKELSAWWEEINLDSFIFNLEADIKQRIPDKYLKSHGWD